MSGSRLVVVDIGNSYAKLGLFSPDVLKRLAPTELPVPELVRDFPTADGPENALLRDLPAERLAWRVSSVNRAGSEKLRAWIGQHRTADEVRFLSYRDLPIEVEVDEPEKVGLDRLAAAVAANLLRRANTPAIVVGAGTAVTVNLISANGAFQGGAILPGFRLSAEALYGGADFLPLAILEPNAEPPLALGKNTEHAIRSGLFWGAVGAVRELITELKRQLPVAPVLIITGGDLRRLSPLVDEHAQYVPHLTLSGLALASLAID